MYADDVPEQMIKDVTGHSDCVNVYKRTSDEIREHASNTVRCSVETQATSINVHREIPKQFDVVLGKVSSLMEEMFGMCCKKCGWPSL